MSASDRSSGRVVDEATSSLPKGHGGPNSGADVGEVLAVSNRARSGRRTRARVAGSLSDRHWAILRSLEGLSYLTTRQVERLHYPPSDFTPLSAARSSRRDLAFLHDHDLVRHLERRVGGVRAGSASYVWCLATTGARLLGEPSRRRSREPSSLHLDHVLAVAELVVQVHERSRDHQMEVVTVEPEPDCWRSFPAAQGGQRTLKPDLRLTLAAGDAELHWFVEIDLSTEHRPVLTRKCRTYLAAWRAGHETAQVGVFPRVLWVVPDEDRAQLLDALIDRLPDVPQGMFVVCTTEAAVGVLSDWGGTA